MIETMTVNEMTSDIANGMINTDVSEVISKLVASDITFTIITTFVGIIAGAACAFPKRFWRNFTFIVSAIVMDLYLFARWIFASGNKYEYWYQNIEFWIFVVSTFLSVLLCLFGIMYLRQRDIVSRKKIGKMIEKFTESADPHQPVCIFAGDLNFFGSVVKKNQNGDGEKKEDIKNEDDIEDNDQFKQLVRLKCRDICVLCIKPPTKDIDVENKYQEDRVRLGCLASVFNNDIHFKFVDDKSHSCNFYNQNNCKLLQCTECQSSASCPQKRQNLKHSLPDTTLRGRIVTNRETGAKCVAITTKRSSGKDYILRQYGAGEKESSLYDVIWKVWWNECSEDLAFINSCKTEYEDYAGISGGN